MPLSPEEKLRDVRAALEELHETPGRWRQTGSFMPTSRLAPHWRNAALQRLVLANFLERTGERRETYYRVQEETPLPSDEELSQTLWPGAAAGIDEDAPTESVDEAATTPAPITPLDTSLENLLGQVVEGVAGLTKLTAIMFTRLESVERRLVDQGAQNDMVLEAASKLEDRAAALDLDKIGEDIAAPVATAIATAITRGQANLDQTVKTLNELGEALQQAVSRNFQALAAGSSELAKSTVDALAKNAACIEAIASDVAKLKAAVAAAAEKAKKHEQPPRAIEDFELKVASSFKYLQQALQEMTALLEQNTESQQLVLTAVGRLIEQMRPDIMAKIARSATGLPLVLVHSQPDNERKP